MRFCQHFFTKKENKWTLFWTLKTITAFVFFQYKQLLNNKYQKEVPIPLPPPITPTINFQHIPHSIAKRGALIESFFFV